MVLGATLISIILAGYLWQELALRELGYWLLLIFLSAILRTVVFRSFNSTAASSKEEIEEDHSRWGALFWVTSMFAGSIWGLLPLLFGTELSSENLLLISTIFAGMVAVTASAGNIYPPAYYSFALPLVIPLIILELLSGDDVLLVTATMLILYILVNVLLVRRGHRQFVELVEARYENANLMNRLNEEKEVAETAVEIKNRFIAVASHDLRQPLHALGMFISSLRKRESDRERLEIIEDIEASTSSLSELLHGLLDLSRLEAGVVIPEMQCVRFADITEKLSGEYAAQAQQKALCLEIEDSDVALLVDPMLLERVLRNLLSNAINYTAEGMVRVSVDDDTVDYAYVLVSDTGPGIADSARDQVFKEYFRSSSFAQPSDTVASSDTPNSAGMGLGLSIVQRLCQLMAITITVESNVGSSGTVFRLKIPKAQESRVSIGSKETIKTPYSPMDISQQCVLLIDDEYQVRKSLSRWLSDQGLHVVEASSGRSALVALARESVMPNLILCDFRLGDGEQGLDTIAALRESGLESVPVAIISGDTSPEVLRLVADSGLPLLHKPVSESSLRELIISELVN